jgi:peptide-methionine (R)-S-oxide reductase
MNLRLLFLAAVTGLAAILAVGAKPAKSSSESPPMAKDALDCKPGEISACGLPSNVVIDMGKTRVQRTDAEWRQMLTPEQYRVARQQGTEPPFRNKYWNNKADGVYFSVCSDTPLFDTRDKFDSGTGWPSFTAPLPDAVGTRTDRTLFMVRTEVHCARCGGHLGHVFPDGPPPTGRRFCMNGVAMTFRPDGDGGSSDPRSA